jgi:hypothetical protein
MLTGVRLKFARTCLKRQVCMHHACMTAGSIAILRSRRRHASETVESVARDRGPSADSHTVPARAAPLRSRTDRDRCRAVRSYGPRPHGSYGRHRGRHRHVVYELAMAQKVGFRPERRLRPQRRDVHRRSNPRSDAERHARALPAHHARSARPPLGIGGAPSHRRVGGSKRVEVHCKTPDLMRHLCQTVTPWVSGATRGRCVARE